MWSSNDKNVPARGFFTPPPSWRSPNSPLGVGAPMSERNPGCKRDLFHVIHKVPPGDSPYVKAKHVQLIEKDPGRAISLFWAAINAGDRVDSALKDMAVVMKQLNRSDEAIEAVKSFRHLCPYDTQESLDNVLVELYKRSGRTEEEIEMLQHKLKSIEEGMAFGGKRTKTARSQGKKIQITAEQEKSRVLGNLAWAYLQQHNYGLAEQHYRKALSLEQDKNKQCNLAICLMHMNKVSEAKSLLLAVRASCGSKPMDESFAKSFERAFEMLTELEPKHIDQDEDSQTSLSLPTTSRSKEVTFPNGDEGYVSEFMDSKICRDGANKVTIHSAEQSTESCRAHSSVDEGNFFQYNKRSSNCTSSGFRGSHASQQTAAENNWRKGLYSGSPNERSGFGTRRKENWTSATRTTLGAPQKKTFSSAEAGLYTQPRTNQHRGYHFESPKERSGFAPGMKENWATSAGTTLDSAQKKTFSSPAAVLYTQPRRRCSWGFNEEDEKRKVWGTDTVEQRQPHAADMLEHTIRNLNGDLQNSVDGKSEITGEKSQYSSKTPHKSWADMVEEEENDENADSNTIHRSESPVESTRKKFEAAVDLNDTPPSRNRAVRRSLSFEGDGEDANSKRRGRLQVFRDITPVPDSP